MVTPLIIPPETLIPSLHVRMKGFFRIRTINKFSGKVRIDTGWMPNKILDAGRNNMAVQANWLTHCHVGTNSTTPTALDTTLLGYVAGTSQVVANSYGAQNSAPYFGWRRKTFRFDVGQGQGGQNLSEAGVGWAVSGATLISRALIIDPDTQLPTTVTPLSDEILDVTYELRYYPPLADAINTVTLNGVVYDTTTRAASVTDGDAWGLYIGTNIGKRAPVSDGWPVYDGNIGTITQGPSGTNDGIDDPNNILDETYSSNSYQRVMVAACGPTGWILGSGIRSILVLTTAGAYQTEFSAQSGGGTVPKTTSFTLDLGWTLGWTEKV